MSDSDVVVRFRKAAYPVEVAALEAANEKLDTAVQSGDARHVNHATIEVHQRMLALLRAPSEEHQRWLRGH